MNNTKHQTPNTKHPQTTYLLSNTDIGVADDGIVDVVIDGILDKIEEIPFCFCSMCCC